MTEKINNCAFILPVYNESKRISNLANWINWHKSNTENSELILSLNGCKDNTLTLAKEFKYNNLIIIENKKRGRGYAIIDALNFTSKPLACIASLDNAWDRQFYKSAYNILDKNKLVFCVYGPKDHRESKQIRPISRKIISFFSKVFLRTIFFRKLHKDTQCIKMFRVDNNFIKNLKPYNYFFDTQFFLLNYKRNLQYKDIPVKIRDNNKFSKVRISLIIQFIFESFHYLFTNDKN